MEDDFVDDEYLEMEMGNKEDDVYSDEGREDLVENGEITSIEQGFMEGAELDGQQAKCANCGQMLTPGNTIEKQMEGETKWFCSEECVQRYEEKHKEE
ncbi:MAG: hypothetical protein R6U32_05055 [Candidatus Woesearchaeota archaeon]